MATKLSIDGVTFNGRGEILSWGCNPIASQIKVDWGNDIVFLDGTSSETKEIKFIWTFKLDQIRLDTGAIVVSGTNGTTRSAIAPNFFNVSCTVAGRKQSSLLADVVGTKGSRLNICDNSIEAYSSNFNIGTIPYVVRIVTATNTTIAYRWDVYDIQNSGTITGYEVTTNTGAKSSRQTTTPPIVSAVSGDGCDFVINYADGSQSPPIRFSQPPQDVFLVDDEDQVCQNACNLANSIINKLG